MNKYNLQMSVFYINFYLRQLGNKEVLNYLLSLHFFYNCLKLSHILSFIEIVSFILCLEKKNTKKDLAESKSCLPLHSLKRKNSS